MTAEPLGLFQGIGIEIEYMAVDREDLSVLPVADELLRSKVGSYEAEIENGAIAWSNELALHVVELKTNGPSPSLAGLSRAFQDNVREVNERLAPLGGMLLPGAAHPWMDPHREFRLWPHEYSPIYAAFDRIFDCSGHGWANLQSTHVNLPFAGDEEFARLHAAIRLVLPILPALAASSPILEGAHTGSLDTRLELYRTNARRVPSVTGAVIPESVASRASYEREILDRIYGDLHPLDPEGTLRHEWVNARGCIARFDRSAIEIRVLDTQECPRADLAVAAATVALVRSLVEEKLSSHAAQQAAETAALAALLIDVAKRGGDAEVPGSYLALLGSTLPGGSSAGQLWRDLIDRIVAREEIARPYADALETILAEGCLARRLLRRLGDRFGRTELRTAYRELAECLASGTLFRARA